jgi:hypothetical protein
MTWNDSQGMAQFMKEIVQRWHVNKERGVEHKGRDSDHGQRLFDNADVMPPKDVELSLDVRKLMTPQWMIGRVTLHGYPQSYKLDRTVETFRGRALIPVPTGRQGQTSWPDVMR